MKSLCSLPGTVALVPILFISVSHGAAGKEPALVPVGVKKQLLVDDFVIAEKRNVTRELGTVTKANDGQPVLVADKPWENADLFRLGAVFRDGNKLRLWYQMNDDLFGYAESEDGLHWTKPNLGWKEYDGSKENNSTDPMGFGCFLDPHETDPQHKYKSAYGHRTKIMVCLAHSPDGFHWTPYHDGQPVTARAADTMNQVLWDEDAKVYRLYTRTDFGQGLYAGTIEENRGTRDMTNPDLKANPSGWKVIREWQFDREGRWEYKRRQVYSLNGWLYEGVHFGLLWCYEWPGALGEGSYDPFKRHERDVLNTYILTTRGEKMWNMEWVYAGKPLIPRGPDGSFDKDWVQPAPNIVTWKDRHWLYYAGSKERHNIYTIREKGLPRWQCAIGLATLRLDGFVCLQAKEDPGIVVTKPFELKGNHLEVNVDAGHGEIAVEVLDKQGVPIPGFSLDEAKRYRDTDDLRLGPRWRKNDDLSTLEGQIVRLKFHLRNAKLYSFTLQAVAATPADARVAAEAVERMPLVNAARGQCTLVLPENATKQNRAAAELLRDNLARSTGARLPIEAESKSNPAKPRVHVGLTDFAKRKCGNLSDLDDDGFVLFPVDEKNLILAGPTDWGTEFAVCDFLERFVGVRWLLPGPQGTYVPKQTDVSGPAEKIQQEPACFSRLFSGLRGDAQGVWARRNRMHGRVSFHHNLLRLFPPSKYGKTHPEFFPIHDGKRYIPARDDIHGWQPCFSAPGIVDEAVRNIKAYFKAHPETTSYSLGVTDSAGHCQCDACQAQDPGTNNAIGIRDVSDRYFAWCNKVVNAVLKEYPDKWFGCLAYRQVFEPPGKIKVHPRIIPYLTYDRMKWADPEQREAGHRLTERWQRVCPTLGWYEYLYGTPYLLPRVYFHQMAENYRYASRHGVRAHYAEAYPNWGEGPKLYLSLKLQWDPDQDVDALLRDWYVACVGEDAADDLAAYYRLWEGFWTGPALKSDWFTPRGEYLRFSSPEYLQAVTPKMIQQSGNRLRAALAKTKTDDQRARATLLLHAFEYYQVSALAYLGGRKINVEDILTEKDALTVLADAPRTIQMADRRLELVNSFADDPVLVHPLPPTRYPLLAGLSRWSIAAMWGLQPWAERSEAVRHRLDELARSDMPAVAREAKTLLQFTAGHYQLVSKNPSFEAGKNKTADDWSFWVKSSGTLQRTNEVRHDGNWSVVAEGFARGGPYQVLPVTPGRYIGVCQVYVPSGQESRGTVELAITMRDATGKNLEEAKTRITPAPGNWISVAAVLDVTAASRGKDVTHVLFCPIVNGFRGDQRVYLDDCRLVRLTE